MTDPKTQPLPLLCLDDIVLKSRNKVKTEILTKCWERTAQKLTVWVLVIL